jgi:hypothetical protein
MRQMGIKIASGMLFAVLLMARRTAIQYFDDLAGALDVRALRRA